MKDIKRVCVYCASSRQADPKYSGAASTVGKAIADAGITLVYGGGSLGSMGAMAEAALSAGGRVIGVLPRFMYDLEWGHHGLTELILVDDMHERMRLMIEEVDAVVALPGGSGTLEELMEAITWKRLGLFVSPIVLLNLDGYFDGLLAQFDRAVAERFMDRRHLDMWSVASRAEDVVEAIRTAPHWDEGARDFAAL